MKAIGSTKKRSLTLEEGVISIKWHTYAEKILGEEDFSGRGRSDPAQGHQGNQILQQGLPPRQRRSQNAQPCSFWRTQRSHGSPPRYLNQHIGSYHEEQGHGVFVVTDVIYLPVESSETRVTADDETYTLIAGIDKKRKLTQSG